MKEFWGNGLATLYQSDAREIPLQDKSVHCVVTSPPYFGLRVYRTEGKVIGLEQTPEQFLDAMMEVFNEVYRVLRDDGQCWVNIGDSYGGSGKGQNGDGSPSDRTGAKQATNKGTLTGGLPAKQNHALEPGTKAGEAGQLLLIPARFALRMQEAGWILRSDVIWHKRSPMPESLAGTRWERHRRKFCLICQDFTKFYAGRCLTCDEKESEYRDCQGCGKCRDNDGLILRHGSWRCTSSYEHIYQFVKSMGYWSDGEAVKTALLRPDEFDRKTPAVFGGRNKHDGYGTRVHSGNEYVNHLSGANRRDVWSDIKPEPYGGQHYATFPPDLPRLCIQASTSEAGCCPSCGAQWARVTNKSTNVQSGLRQVNGRKRLNELDNRGNYPRASINNETFGWRPTCDCPQQLPGHLKPISTVPATVLDPFCGTGTTMLAALRLGRQSVGVDLSEDYLNQAIKRLSKQSLPMGALI